MLELLNQNPLVFFVFIIIMLISLSFHEFFHALAAHHFGDDTAKYLGRLSLNPKKHLDLFGTISFLLFGFGWGKPVPVNSFLLKNPKRDSLLVALAGPFANLILVILATILLKILMPFLALSNLLMVFLTFLLEINLILMFFNLIPLPPLDGYSILVFIFGEKIRTFFTKYAYMIFLSLIFASIVFNIPVFSWIFSIVKAYFSLFNLTII